MKAYHILIIMLLFSLYGCANYGVPDSLPESCKNLSTFSTEKTFTNDYMEIISSNNTTIRTFERSLAPVSPHSWYNVTLQLTDPIELRGAYHGYETHAISILKTDTACLSEHVQRMVHIVDRLRYGYDLPTPPDMPYYIFKPELTYKESVNLNQIRLCLVDLNKSMEYRNRFLDCDESEEK